ncbi:hypothetical protein BDD12DRAFT_809877 [Trichophaea hybrida]|nr:hypothetical protein BDD12DRAFT_809877 [Trichophaea hybrida]
MVENPECKSPIVHRSNNQNILTSLEWAEHKVKELERTMGITKPGIQEELQRQIKVKPATPGESSVATTTDDDASSTGASTEGTDTVSQTSSEPILEVTDDSWLDDDWNAMVHRCHHCDRPFRSEARLEDHVRIWHSDESVEIDIYEFESKPGPDVDLIEEIIVVGGDLIIKASISPTDSIGYLVGSQILYTTSSVFRDMFGRDSLCPEATDIRRANVLGFSPAVVSLDDDDSQALGLVLKVLHHRYDELPDEVSFNQIVHIAAICEKYKLHQSLQPLANRLPSLYLKYSSNSCLLRRLDDDSICF